MREKRKIAVVGGGASGMMAAITAAREGGQVTLFERNDRVGKKILATGNGKCNFTNLDMDETHYYGERERLTRILAQFGEKSAVQFFEDAGMLVKSKNGYLYPASEQAATVLDILRLLMRDLPVEIICDRKVTAIQKEKNGLFSIQTPSGKQTFDRVILACGSKAAPKTGSDGSGYELAKSLGHSITPVVPALVQLRCSENWLKAVSGVRTEVLLGLYIDGKKAGEERGELQFTDYGVSGIVTFQLSRMAAYALRGKKKVSVYIDCFPGISPEEYEALREQRMNAARENDTVEDFFTGMLNKKLMLAFMKLAGLKPTDLFRKSDRKKIKEVFSLCRELGLTVQDTNSFDNAQVCAGGVPLSEVSEQMESLKVPGLYLAGELLDVDGKCGGYNLQWAWSSGYVAGLSVVQN